MTEAEATLAARRQFGNPTARTVLMGGGDSNAASLPDKIAFLEDNFKNMTTFLRMPSVQRNSLAETGMRVLRRQPTIWRGNVG
jgi:hypothetical protein